MGGTMATMFTTLYPELVRNLILMAAPIDFDVPDWLLSLWTDEKYFDVDALIDTYGNCPGTMLQSSFALMKPMQNFVEKHYGFVDRLHDEGFLENFFAMERWSNDNIPVAEETFREFVKLLYQRNMLVKGEFRLGEQPILLDQITCPLLMLVAEFDHLVPPQSTLALEEHVSSREVKALTIDAGHIGLAVSSKAHRLLWPEAAMWIADHSTNRIPSPTGA
jgi:polyhydroxyalkanoate synthase